MSWNLSEDRFPDIGPQGLSNLLQHNCTLFCYGQSLNFQQTIVLALCAFACPKPSVDDRFVLSIIWWATLVHTSGQSSHSTLCYFKIININSNRRLFRDNTMRGKWIDLKCSSLYVFTSLPPIKNNYNNSRLGTGCLHMSNHWAILLALQFGSWI